ncbi:MAG TPA: ABC transporter substrate-binding protein [Casimicrobiaceae bacterium]|nr:ABC transporter substrate-binding protein [Casimicrobiaceae bacterium]
MNRRRVLKAGGAAIAAPLLAPLPSVREAFAKPDHIVVMTWGGQWGDAMRDNVDAAYEKATGIKVIQERGASPAERITKIKVSEPNPTADCFQLADGLVPLAIKQGVCEKIDRNSPRMPNLRDMIPTFWNDYWVPQIFSVIGIVYNTKLVKNPPTGWEDLWRPEFKGRIVLPEISHSIGSYIIPIGAVAAGKPPDDEEAGFAMLKKMAALRPIWAKDTDTMMNSMRTGDAMIGILYKSQTYTVKGYGAPVEWVYPKEGGIAYTSGTCIAKGTKNLEAAEQYINTTMDPNVQTFAAKIYNYGGTNKNTLSKLSPELQERVKFPQEQLDHLIKLDLGMMTERRAAWVERWNRTVAG